MKSKANLQELYRSIPSIQELLQNSSFRKFPIGESYLKKIIQHETQALRKQLSQNHKVKSKDIPQQLITNISNHLEKIINPSLKGVINATGIILHTNLGRAPLAKSAQKALLQSIGNYGNLEMDLESGERGERNKHVQELLCLLTGAEAAIVVNNNAAAVLLALNSLARRKEVPVSRGELVEIGGSYRMPDVMKASGVKMIEVGTTNKTHFKDYEKVLNPKTAAILKVHTSNYRIKGFVSEVSLNELVDLAHKNDLPVIYDMGSGALINLSKYGVKDEPLAEDIVKTGVDVVCFSGDKLLGGPQSGIIIGKKKFIDKIRKNHLTRALRCDKLTFGVLEATSKLYLNPEKLADELPIISMLNLSVNELRKRANQIKEKVKTNHLEIDIRKTTSQMGSGTLPLIEIPSMALVIKAETYSPQQIAAKLRKNQPPIICYVKDDACFLNLRTIRKDEISIIIKALNKL
jgi:L-seryl-tRNA(Ser) seleniumtransferase